MRDNDYSDTSVLDRSDQLMREREVARAILVNPEGKAFLARRARGFGANQWALIGGKPEGQETMEETIIREVLEETGLQFQPVFFRDDPAEHSEVDDQLWHVCYFYGMVDQEPVLAPDENSEGIFVAVEDLGDLDIAFNHDRILLEFFENRRVV